MMFKEELHTSFDRISPAPELLDRISAMMSEESAKPKKPIYMNAVKYGGIAAAVVLAAGATIAVVQNTGRGNIATESVAANTTAATAAADDAAYDDGAERFMPDTLAAALPEITEAAAQPEEIYEETPEETVQESVAAAGETAASTTAEPADYAIAGEEAVQDNSADMTMAKSVPEPENNSAEDEPLPAVLAAAAPEYPEEPEYEPEAEDYGDYGSDDALFIEEAEAADEADMISPTASMYAGEAADNPATGGFDTMQFENPFQYRFYTIPESLMDTVDGIREEQTDQWGGRYTVMGEKWREFIGMFAELTPDDEDVVPVSADDPPTFRDITAIDEDFNIYTFIEYFNVPDETAREALAGYLTEEQINILLSGDKASITAEFASSYAIVKGRKIYAPLWLERYPTDEWKTAGITKEDIKEKYDVLTNVPYLREDLQETLTRKLDEFLG